MFNTEAPFSINTISDVHSQEQVERGGEGEEEREEVRPQVRIHTHTHIHTPDPEALNLLSETCLTLQLH